MMNWTYLRIYLMDSTPFSPESFFLIVIVGIDVIEYAFFPSTKTIFKLLLVCTFHFASDLKSIIHFFVLNFERINVLGFILHLFLGHLQRNETFLVRFQGHCWVQLSVVVWEIAYLVLSSLRLLQRL